MLSHEYWRTNIILPSFNYVSFVAKIQKAKTRKGKDYFVLRATVPKDVAERINAKPGDYLFFKARKAEWYHMLDWRQMETTWRMLPSEIKNQAILEGLPYPGLPSQMPRFENLSELCLRLRRLFESSVGSTSSTTDIVRTAERLVATTCVEALSAKNTSLVE